MSQPLKLRCNASGQQYTSYGLAGQPDEANRMPCPVCGKNLKLLAKYRAYGSGPHRVPARLFVMIPSHNRSGK